MKTEDIKPGDEVRVFDGTRAQPPGGWPGTVTRIGRTLLDIQYCGRVQAFRRDTQVSNEKQYGYGTKFLTLDEVAEDEHTFSTEQIEKLADLVRSFTKEG